MGGANEAVQRRPAVPLLRVVLVVALLAWPDAAAASDAKVPGDDAELAALAESRARRQVQRSIVQKFMRNFADNMKYAVLEDSKGDMPEEERQRLLRDLRLRRRRLGEGQVIDAGTHLARGEAEGHHGGAFMLNAAHHQASLRGPSHFQQEETLDEVAPGAWLQPRQQRPTQVRMLNRRAGAAAQHGHVDGSELRSTIVPAALAQWEEEKAHAGAWREPTKWREPVTLQAALAEAEEEQATKEAEQEWSRRAAAVAEEEAPQQFHPEGPPPPPLLLVGRQSPSAAGAFSGGQRKAPPPFFALVAAMLLGAVPLLAAATGGAESFAW